MTTKMNLERVNAEGSKVPQLKITLANGTVGYLAPRKAYQFQVSATIDGSGDIGSSEVVGLGNIVLAFKGYKKPESGYSAFSSNGDPLEMTFNAFAKNAFDAFSSTEDAGYMGYEEQIIWNRFITDCVTYVTELVAIHMFKEAM